MAARQTIYLLMWNANANAQPCGAFSTLALAKEQAQRRSKKHPLEWNQMTTDSKVCRSLHEAALPTWHAQPAYIQIWEIAVDAKAFRC